MILVTGGTGLVGSHLLLDLVRSGQHVRAIYRNKERLSKVRNVFSYTKEQPLFDQIEWVQADLTDVPALEAAFQNITRVYHCAAVVSFDTSKDALVRKVNIEGTANVVNYCIKNKIEKLCFVSSIATFDPKAGEKVLTETSFFNKELDHSMYAISKYGAEMEVWRAGQEGIPVVIVNPGVIIGPGFWNSGPGKIFRKIHSGLDYYIPKTTGFVGVWDVVEIMQKLMDSPIENQQFIVVSENLSFRQIFAMTAAQLHREIPKRALKKWMIFTAWIWQEIRSPFSRKEKHLDSRSVKTLYGQTYYSSEKLETELAFTFEPISEVVAKTADSFKKDIAT